MGHPDQKEKDPGREQSGVLGYRVFSSRLTVGRHLGVARAAVPTVAAVSTVAAGATDHDVVTPLSADHVVARAAAQFVVARAAPDAVTVCATEDPVRAAARAETSRAAR